jgi:predicted PolB exonuclease-like 3'-5' exonuclease
MVGFVKDPMSVVALYLGKCEGNGVFLNGLGRDGLVPRRLYDDFSRLLTRSNETELEFEYGRWEVQAVGAPHVGQRTEKELIESFVNKIGQLSPQMVTYNGCAFDLPVLRYRAMIHEAFAPGMHNRAYFHRYTDDNVDLCDVLSSFSYGGKVKLDELSRIMGLPGKPDGIDGSQVEAFFNAGRIQDIADYCKSDAINTYRLWLRHELFRGRLDQNQFESSERDVTRVVGSAADRAAG